MVGPELSTSMHIIPVQFAPKRSVKADATRPCATIIALDQWLSSERSGEAGRCEFGIILPWEAGLSAADNASIRADGNLLYLPAPDFPPSAA